MVLFLTNCEYQIYYMRTLLFLQLSFLSLSSWAQQRSVISNSYAYMQIRFAGAIAADQKGNKLSKGVDTSYIIYHYCPTKKMKG